MVQLDGMSDSMESGKKKKGISVLTEIPFVYLAVPAGFEPAFSP
jgi:hypothetical protein